MYGVARYLCMYMYSVCVYRHAVFHTVREGKKFVGERGREGGEGGREVLSCVEEKTKCACACIHVCTTCCLLPKYIYIHVHVRAM